MLPAAYARAIDSGSLWLEREVVFADEFPERPKSLVHGAVRQAIEPCVKGHVLLDIGPNLVRVFTGDSLP